MSDDQPPAARHPLGVVAQRLADVSPDWARASADPDSVAPGTIDVGTRDRTIGVESIREGWLLHRDASRLAPDASPKLALLVGDWCYAAGLCEVADHGSLDDIATLADLVADLSARATESVDALEERWSSALTELTPRGPT